MPRTATPRSNARQTTGRTTSQSQPAESHAAPVLFRLPQIDLSSLIKPATAEAKQFHSSAGSSAPAEAASSNQSNQGLGSESSSAAAPQSDSSHVGDDEDISSESNSLAVAIDARPESATSRPAPRPSLEKEAAPAATASTLDDRSWWEHWSSGVVLILLVIALVAASIMALNDRGDAQPHVLADKPGDELTMATLDPAGSGTVGKPQSRKDNPASASQSTAPGTPESRTAAVADDGNTNPAASAGASLPQNLDAGHQAQPAVSQATGASVASSPGLSPGAERQGSLMVQVPDGPLSQVPVPQLELTSSASVAANEASAQKTPSGATVAPPALINASNDLGLPGLLSEEQPIGQACVAAAPPERSEQIQLIPELPTLDVAANQDGQPAGHTDATAAPVERPMEKRQPNYQTQSPTYESLLGTSPESPGTDAMPRSEAYKTASHATQVAGQTVGQTIAGSADGKQVRKSTTPDMNAEALIRAYQEFRQLHQMTTQPANRYPPGTVDGEAAARTAAAEASNHH